MVYAFRQACACASQSTTRYAGAHRWLHQKNLPCGTIRCSSLRVLRKEIFMANSTNSLSHTKWLCKYHIVIVPTIPQIFFRSLLVVNRRIRSKPDFFWCILGVNTPYIPRPDMVEAHFCPFFDRFLSIFFRDVPVINIHMWSDMVITCGQIFMWSNINLTSFLRLSAAHFTCGQCGAEQFKPFRKAQKSPFHTRSVDCGSIPLFQVIVKPVPTFSRCIFCDAIDKEKGDGVKMRNTL